MARSAHHSTTEDREKDIAIIKGLIERAFVKQDTATFGSASTLIVEFENSLRRSKYETGRYEFKIGICELGANPKIDKGIFAKLGRTACAIANTTPKQDGYIYLGVADNIISANRVNELYGSEITEIGDVHFVGLEHDLKILGIDMENYLKNSSMV